MIDKENLLLEKMRTGICLFTGAGFSLLPNTENISLPVVSELKEELLQKFGVDEIFKDDLDMIAELCPKIDLQNFLRERFKVTSYNKLYSVINRIKIKTFVTTNIDNIVRKVISDGGVYYLNNMREYGAATNAPNELYYIPLHGDVTDINSHLYFGKFELTQVTAQNKDLFDAMSIRLRKEPILFWGYSFNDSGVLNIVTKLIEQGCNDIWIQCFPGDETHPRNEKLIKFFKSKGCNIIEADTKSLLNWIDSKMLPQQIQVETNASERLRRYRIPALEDVASVPNTDFFQQGNTQWYSILAGIPFERAAVNDVYDKALKKKNAIILGDRFTGKTTTIMQLAVKVNHKNKYYVDTPSLEEAEFICKNIKDSEAWIFIHNCTADINAYKCFAQKQNIKVIGTSDEYRFETIKHLINENDYATTQISEVTENEAREIYNKIPVGLKNTAFTYKTISADRYSMFEFIGKNVSEALTKRKVSTMLNELLKNDITVFELIAITTYLNDNNSALSYEIVSSCLNVAVYPDAVELVKKTQEYLREYLVCEDNLQDYYILRSKLFAQIARKILITNHKQEYARIIEDFIKNVSPYKILHYREFRRKGFDAELFYSLFTYDKAIQLFEYLYDRYNSPYMLQQKALCCMKFKDFDNAFINIDKALSISPYNFSIQNSEAIIMFEANKDKDDIDSLEYLKKAMGILNDCFNNDKRKPYHAQKFAEFAIFLRDKRKCSDYILDAQKWIKEIMKDVETISERTKVLAKLLG